VVLAASQVTGTAIVSNPSSTQTISAPPKAGVIPLQIKGHPQDGANLLEIYDSQNPPSLQSYFDLNGAFRTSKAPTFSTTTSGSILFAGTGGLLSQDNNNLFWDNTGKSLRVGPSRDFWPGNILGTQDSFDPAVSWVPAYGQHSLSVSNPSGASCPQFCPGAALSLLNQDNTTADAAEAYALWATAAGTNASEAKAVVAGLASDVQQLGNGNVTWLLGLLTGIGNSGSGTISLVRHVGINSTSNTGGGAIVNNYGIKIEDQTAGITNWALRTGLGKVQFGDAVLAPKINNVRYANQFAGADAGAKIAAAIADLPSTGGTVDARGLEGAQTIASDPFTGVTKPVRLLLGAATFSHAVTINVPANVRMEGLGDKTIFNWTGAGGTAFSVNPGPTGQVTDADVVLSNFKIQDGGTGAIGVHLKDISNWHLEKLTITGFSTAGIQLDASNDGGTITGTIKKGSISGNGNGIETAGANIHNAISIEDNDIVSSTGFGLSFGGTVAGFFIKRNNFSNNSSGEIISTNAIRGTTIVGNWFESLAAGTSAISLSGSCASCTMDGLEISGNMMANNAANATGRALLMGGTATAPGFSGIEFHGNFISGYGNTTNPAVDFQGKTFANSDFSGNFFAASVTTPYGNLPAAASTNTIVQGIGNTDQNGKITALSAGTVTSDKFVGALVPVTFSTTPDFNAFLGNTFKMTLTGNVTSSTISNASTGQFLTLLLCQDGTGNRTMTWPTNLKLSGGSFTLTTTGSKCDSLTAIYDGSNWYETARATNL
ncbi:MAG: hypothetical protein HY647_05850, partial [Acidobacteria bacterium]|nr:hypothetical protein [Acidobacteriota bacterium]